MCGRFTITVASKKFFKRFHVPKQIVNLKVRYNIGPGQMVPIIYNNGKENVAVLAKWGLTPGWIKKEGSSRLIFNARAESVAEKHTFKKSFQTRRCLVPASGFYEWEHDGDEKIPYYLKLNDADLFAFAGIYQVKEDENGVEEFTFTIITTEPNSKVKKIHDRMPVILKPEHESIWLDPKHNEEPEMLQSLLKPFSSKAMDMYQVSKKVNHPKPEGPELIEPV